MEVCKHCGELLTSTDEIESYTCDECYWNIYMFSLSFLHDNICEDDDIRWMFD